jgi:hypothetical protein
MEMEKVPEKSVELSESDFFDRNFRVLHLDIKGPDSLQYTLNTLEMFERAIQLKTGVKFLSLIEHFDLLTSNFYGSELALLLSCSRDSQFPLYRISELKSALKEGSFELGKLNLKDMKFSQACLEVLLPTHDKKVPFLSTPSVRKDEVDIGQLISFFQNQKHEGLKYKNKILKKEQSFLKDEIIEAQIITSYQSLIMNKCEIWSVGDKSHWNSTAYSVADRLQIDVVKIIINGEKDEKLIEEFTKGFKIETTLNKTMPWFYYYVKNCNRETLDLAQDNSQKIEERELFSLRNLVIHNGIIKNITLKKGVNIPADELWKALSFWEGIENPFSYQEAASTFKRCGFQNLAIKRFHNPEDVVTTCLMLTYLCDKTSIPTLLPREVINIICVYHWYSNMLW